MGAAKKTIETDGYDAVQIGFDEKKEKNTSAGMKGHFKKAGAEPVKQISEFRDFNTELNVGEHLTVDMFTEGEKVHVKGTSKEKVFRVWLSAISSAGWVCVPTVSMTATVLRVLLAALPAKQGIQRNAHGWPHG